MASEARPPGTWVDRPAAPSDRSGRDMSQSVSEAAVSDQPSFVWSQGLDGVPALHAQGPYFLELFSGTAGLSEAVQSAARCPHFAAG